jgi:DNA-binding response OmpR family regulator
LTILVFLIELERPAWLRYQDRCHGDSPKPGQGRVVGPFNPLVGERLLKKDGAPVELGARAFDILLVLLSTPNETVSKKDLMSRVWPDVTR